MDYPLTVINGELSLDELDKLVFTNKESQLLYALLCAGANERERMLGVSRRHYIDKDLAYSWLQTWLPQLSGQTKFHAEARSNLNRFYRQMVGDA